MNDGVFIKVLRIDSKENKLASLTKSLLQLYNNSAKWIGIEFPKPIFDIGPSTIAVLILLTQLLH